MLLTLFGDVDQVPDLARSALALIFRMIPTNTHKLAGGSQAGATTRWIVGCRRRGRATYRFLTSLIYWSSALDAWSLMTDILPSRRGRLVRLPKLVENEAVSSGLERYVGCRRPIVGFRAPGHRLGLGHAWMLNSKLPQLAERCFEGYQSVPSPAVPCPRMK